MAEDDRDGGRAFKPSFPFYLVYGNRSLMTVRKDEIKFVLACATRELGELVCSQFKSADRTRHMGLQPVPDRQKFCIIARQLIEQGVTHMSWNAMRESTVVNVVALADLTEPGATGLVDGS